nr:synphilin-1-like [Biomphalaria glabrata]
MTSPKGETYHEQDVQHLFRAIRKGKGHLTRFMLAASNNALLNCWDKEGKTPLIECCYIKTLAFSNKWQASFELNGFSSV